MRLFHILIYLYCFVLPISSLLPLKSKSKYYVTYVIKILEEISERSTRILESKLFPFSDWLWDRKDAELNTSEIGKTNNNNLLLSWMRKFICLCLILHVSKYLYCIFLSSNLDLLICMIHALCIVPIIVVRDHFYKSNLLKLFFIAFFRFVQYNI